MKLLVFAHTPPPHHGQSYMVELMLDGFGGDRRKSAGSSNAVRSHHGLECYHVNARVSRELEDIGGVRLGKLLLLATQMQQLVVDTQAQLNTPVPVPPAPVVKTTMATLTNQQVINIFDKAVGLPVLEAQLSAFQKTTLYAKDANGKRSALYTGPAVEDMTLTETQREQVYNGLGLPVG